MIAYFALLSFVPILFLALSLTALAGQQTESSYLVEELRRAFPASSVDRLLTVVRSIQDQATSIGIIGGVALLWGSLGFFSVLESAFNIVYGLPNRSFVRQKLLVLALVASSLAVLFVALVVGSVGVDLIHNTGVAGGVLSYVSGVAGPSSSLDECVAGANAVFFDGTFWTRDELVALGVGTRYAEDMAHWPLAGEHGSLEFLRRLPAERKLLIHVNNTNPILDEDSAERGSVRAAGVQVAEDGLEFAL